ncbi:hypothetical protein RHMOL_Rhmol07G0262700 [Rhododendron molle]|uniref:Uncharacterized protein n=1 Tax=Rhododendron molle TaxID=49168 RepID=A0ACC0N6T6_RHOML|nr:hypothetical protein RHMOL_Rhmol07G0262700 [Rhododendron molle]
MAGDLVDSFPNLLSSNPLRISSSDSSISRVSPKIDIISMLEKATIPTFEHLKVDASDGPAAKQIKELTAEVLKLNRMLGEKETLLVSKAAPGMPSSSTPTWKDKVFGHKTCPEVVRKSTPVQQTQVWMVKDGAKAVEEGSKPVGNGVHLVLDTAGPIEGISDMVVHSINNEGDILFYKEELVQDASSLDQLRVQSGAGASGSGSVQVGVIDSASNKFVVLQDASGILEEVPTILPSVEEFDVGLVQDMVEEDLVPERVKFHGLSLFAIGDLDEEAVVGDGGVVGRADGNEAKGRRRSVEVV